ncbi:hypothetical protein C0Q70_19952 [Pomacea canaliculata]|uniref:Uncharacterized protein n=1 Tax=Pomacea canaliculata TaxID=400727 RepID=A0A2T7NE62_POMCA|nr:hypothetical protein C0Q70_19952 [Pomacea canaliculata]
MFVHAHPDEAGKWKEEPASQKLWTKLDCVCEQSTRRFAVLARDRGKIHRPHSTEKEVVSAGWATGTVKMAAMMASLCQTIATTDTATGTLTPELLAQILSQQRNAQTMIPTESRDWPSKDVKLGEVSGVDVAPSGEVLVFHRGNRPWTKETFDEYNVMPENQRINISDAAIVRLNAATGQLS